MDLKVAFVWNIGENCGIAEYGKKFYDALSSFNFENIKITAISLPDKKGSLRNFLKWIKSLKNFDIIHVQYDFSLLGDSYYNAALKILLFILLCKSKKILTVHEIPKLKQKTLVNCIKQYASDILHSVLFLVIDKAIVHSVYTQKNIEMLTGGKTSCEVIELPIPTFKKTGVCRLKKDNKKIVLMFGYVVKRKRYDVFFRLADLFAEVTFVIAGGQHPKDSCEFFTQVAEQVTKAKHNNIYLLGHLAEEDIVPTIENADLLLMPYDECFGSAAASFAVAASRPILASDIPYFLGMKTSGAGIVTFEQNNMEDCANILENLMFDKKKLLFLENKQKEFAKMYSYENVAKKIGQSYQKILTVRSF